MMRTASRVVGLFVAYAAIGFGGDFVVGLLGQDAAQPTPSVVIDAEARPTVRVDARPSIVSRVHVRHSGACAFSVDREVTIPAGGVETLALRAGSGALRVEGRSDLDAIVVVGVVCASHEAYLSDLDLTVDEGRDGRVTVVTRYPAERLDDHDHTARIDLVALVPFGMAVDIDDSSGDIETSGTGDLRIDDSSGSIDVQGVNGSLTIDDSSGGVRVADVSGDVAVDDGSGGLAVRDVEGSVSLRDGSGDMKIEEVERDVVVESDGSGSIDVRDVRGDFTVRRDGSGNIRHSGVDGRVDIPQKRRRGR